MFNDNTLKQDFLVALHEGDVSKLIKYRGIRVKINVGMYGTVDFLTRGEHENYMKIVKLVNPIVNDEEKGYMFIEFMGNNSHEDGVALLDYPDDSRSGGADEIVLNKETKLEIVPSGGSRRRKSKRKSRRKCEKNVRSGKRLKKN